LQRGHLDGDFKILGREMHRESWIGELLVPSKCLLTVECQEIRLSPCRPLTVQEASAGATMVTDFDSAKDGQLTVDVHGAPKKIFMFDSVFSHKQKGTRKLFRVEGSEDARGDQFKYEIFVSALEVYNEQMRDLLVPGSQSELTSKRLKIRQDVEGNHYIRGLVEAPVSNMNEVWDVLQTGSNARTVEATNANEHSSQSHWFVLFIFTANVVRITST
ncbi:hypothetical protein GIB67_010170, partial [Kingdonia uniflora]